MSSLSNRIVLIVKHLLIASVSARLLTSSKYVFNKTFLTHSLKVKKIFFVANLITVLFVFSNVNTFAASDAVPVPKLPTNQSDKFDTDLLTGAASYTYPIKVPKGTNGLTPEVSLSYSSSATKNGSQSTGIGWGVTHDYIERDVNYTPGSTSDDKFILHFKGAVHDLVYVPGESRYHTKVESFLNIKKVASGGSNTNGEYWEVLEQDGTKYRFGYQNQSELICSGRDYVKQWDMDLVTDTHDNKIFYTYIDSDGVSYPSSIKYNNDETREVTFGYSSNAAKRWQYIQGCKIREASKLSNSFLERSTDIVSVGVSGS